MEGHKDVFLVGIKGVCMANISLVLKKMGKRVSGSDVADEFITDELLKANKIPVLNGFEASKLPVETDLVIYSSSHQGDRNPQVKEARKRGIVTLPQAQVLKKLTDPFPTSIAVCGSHGKTTTASLLSYALIQLKARPSYIVGTSKFNSIWGGDYAGHTTFVIEADEYAVNPPFDLTPKFHFLSPKYIICTNIDFDHPDVYKDLNAVKHSFEVFFVNAFKKKDAHFFFCSDDKPLTEVAKKIPRNSYTTFGFSEDSDVRIVDSSISGQYSNFKVKLKQGNSFEFSTSLFGQKNISNIASVIALLFHLAYSPEGIRSSIRESRGGKRRFEHVASKNGIDVFDDYAHHPSEISSTVQAARVRFPGRRIVIVFQPHTFSRTLSLKEEFASSLSKADLSIVVPIFSSAREDAGDFHIGSSDIASSPQSKRKIIAVESTEELMDKLRSFLRSGDILFTMGAGDVYKLKNDIIPLL